MFPKKHQGTPKIYSGKRDKTTAYKVCLNIIIILTFTLIPLTPMHLTVASLGLHQQLLILQSWVGKVLPSIT